MARSRNSYATRLAHNSITFFSDFVRHRKIILALAVNDFRSRYLRSYLGMIWAFIQPFATLTTLWFIFTYGFRTNFSSASGRELPFILWLMPALVAWNFLADGFMYSASAIVSNAFLVKKTAIRLSLLPIVKVISALAIHLIFMFIVVVVVTSYQLWPDVYWLQLPYYMLGCCCLLFGLGLIASALSVFAKDIENGIAVCLQFGFWLTPIFWDPSIIGSDVIKYLLKLNPAYYITQGYRDCFIDKIWFWERCWYSLYFWSLVVFILLGGAFIFRRLRPAFADVL